MAKAAETTGDLEGELDVTEAQIWADFDAALKPENLLVEPGPEWKTRAQLNDYYEQARGISASTVDKMITDAIGAEPPRMEVRRGKRNRRTMMLFRVC